MQAFVRSAVLYLIVFVVVFPLVDMLPGPERSSWPQVQERWSSPWYWLLCVAFAVVAVPFGRWTDRLMDAWFGKDDLAGSAKNDPSHLESEAK